MTEDTALTEIRCLELQVAQQLEAAGTAATARLEQARRDAHEQMTIAAAEGRRQADEKHRLTHAAAQERAAAIGRDSRARVQRLIAEAAPQIEEATKALVELVLPGSRETED